MEPVFTTTLSLRERFFCDSQDLAQTFANFGRSTSIHGSGFYFVPRMGGPLDSLALAMSLGISSGIPTDSVRIKIWKYVGTTWTLVATSSNTVLGSLLAKQPDYTYCIFNFTGLNITTGSTYYCLAERTGAYSLTQYYAMPYVGETKRDCGRSASSAATGYSYPNHQVFFRLNFKNEYDLGDRLLQLDIDTGKSELDGEYVESQADLVLNNADDALTPQNTSSPFYGLFRGGAWISIKAYISHTVYLFEGIITNLEPSFRFDERTIDVSLSDMFYEFKEKKLSLNVTGNLSSAQIVARALSKGMGIFSNKTGVYMNPTGAAFWDADIDDDGISMANYAWTDNKVLDILNEVVFAGQHHHFVQGNGRYTFKTNQWRNDGIPDYSYNDECDISNITIPYDYSRIKNRVRVQYLASPTPTYAWTSLLDDLQSIYKYGEHQYDHDTELVPGLTYAELLRTYLLDKLKAADDTCDVELYTRDYTKGVLDLELGSLIQIDLPSRFLSNLYMVQGLGITVDALSQDHKINIRGQRYVTPRPFSNTLIYYPSGEGVIYDPYKLAIGNQKGYGQSWKCPATGTLQSIDFLLMDFNQNDNWTAKLYSVDANDFPVTLLATSPSKLLKVGFWYYASFTFSYAVTVNTKYNITVRPALSNTVCDAWGLTNGTGDPNGSPFYWNGSAWIKHPNTNIDLYLKIAILQ